MIETNTAESLPHGTFMSRLAHVVINGVRGEKGKVSTGAKHFWGLSYGKMIYRGVHPQNNQSRVVFNRRQSIFIDARSHNLNIR